MTWLAMRLNKEKNGQWSPNWWAIQELNMPLKIVLTLYFGVNLKNMNAIMMKSGSWKSLWYASRMLCNIET